MAITAKFKSDQDTRDFEAYFDKLTRLDGLTVEMGFYDKPHYSGLNLATLAAIHQEGWNKLPVRNFMTSSSILFQKDLEGIYKSVFGSIISGVEPKAALARIGIAGARKITFVIDQGLFSNPTVKQSTVNYRNSVGTNNTGNGALFHYGDLKSGVEWKIVSARI